MSNNICNVCGGEYIYVDGRWKCDYCGAIRAINISPEENSLLIDAAQDLRRERFPEAEEKYFDIIEKYPEQHEAYWGYVCARYGVKVEEDFDGKRIPTCCFTTIESFSDDIYFKKAIQYAPAAMRDKYIKYAEYIDRVRKEWIDKAKKEPPYDIFISYKDSDKERGIERTVDSVNAFELYHHLQTLGYRVFYSRESLKDKGGEKYEPYIFQALQTAKVMIVYATSIEYVNSTWVKNEWYRYLKMMQSGKKVADSLIMVCDGFSPSDLPSTLSSRQCYNRSNITFFENLKNKVRSIINKYQPTDNRVLPNLDSFASEDDEKAEISPTERITGIHEHKYREQIVKPTCITKGYTLYKCACGHQYKDNYTDVVEHTFKVKNIVDPTCTSEGYKDKVCEVCGEKSRERIPVLSHSFSKWMEVRRPTCDNPGEEKRTCSECGIVERRQVEPLEHQYYWMNDLKGDKVGYCKICGKRGTGENVRHAVQTPKDNFISTREISDIRRSYRKSFFTKETTILQKLNHFSGVVFTIFSIIFSIIGCNRYLEETLEPSVMKGLLWGIFAVIGTSALFSFVLAIAYLIEKAYKKKTQYTIERFKYSRPGMRTLSSFMLIIGAFCVAAPIYMGTSAYVLALYGVSWIIWACTARFYSFCPTKYKKIQKHNRTISRFNPAIKAFLASVLCYVAIILFYALGVESLLYNLFAGLVF